MGRILVGGDICPIGRNEILFKKGDASLLLDDLLTEFQKADLSILNLECPLILAQKPIEKSGPNLGAPCDCVKGLKAIGVSVLALANNHIMDHGPQGLISTTLALEQNGIAHVGAGEDIEAARKILICQIQDSRVGIMAVAEHEFGIASKQSPGTYPLDIIDISRNISQNRDNYDHLIVLLHAGNEYYPYPRPELMDICHYLVELGAGAVICQQSHCVGCMETYRNAPIIYGQGNFIFDYESKDPAWFIGMLICLETLEKTGFSVRFIPYWQSDKTPGIRRMTSDEETIFMREFILRSEAICDEEFVAKQWEEFCQQNKRYFLHGLNGKPGFVRRIAGKLNLLHYLDSAQTQRTRLQFVRCESLREALITVLTKEAER